MIFINRLNQTKANVSFFVYYYKSLNSYLWAPKPTCKLETLGHTKHFPRWRCQTFRIKKHNCCLSPITMMGCGDNFC